MQGKGPTISLCQPLSTIMRQKQSWKLQTSHSRLRMMQGDKLDSRLSNEATEATFVLVSHCTFSSFVSLFCVPPNLPPPPRPFLITWWSVYCQAIWSVMLFTLSSSQKGKEEKKLTRYDDLPRWCVSLVSWSYGRGQPSKVCVCVFSSKCVCAYSIW